MESPDVREFPLCPDVQWWNSEQIEFYRVIFAEFMDDSIREAALDLFVLLSWGLFSGSDFVCNEFRGAAFQQIKRFSFLQSLLAIEGSTIETKYYKKLFESLMSATHSSYLFNSKEFGPGTDEAAVDARMRSSCSKILPQAQHKAFLLLGPTAAHRFMHFSLSRLTYWSTVEYRSVYLSASCLKFWRIVEVPMLRISYNSNIGRFWKITSYSPLIAMETTSKSPIGEGRLHEALSYHMLYCIFQFEHVINVRPDWIEVCLQMDNIRCDVSPLERKDLYISDGFLNERHFPAKICLAIGPENGCHSISLTRSSQNPITDIGKGNAYELTFEPPKNVGLKASSATTSTVKINNWGFEQSVVNCSDTKIEWTLYDTTTEKAVINKGPPKFTVVAPKTRSIDRYSGASRAFTAEGGVVFTKTDYGDPIIWRFDRHMEGQTLKWIIKGSVWLTYWPNTYHTRYSETKRLDFRQELDLTLVQSSHPKPL